MKGFLLQAVAVLIVCAAIGATMLASVATWVGVLGVYAAVT